MNESDVEFGEEAERLLNVELVGTNDGRVPCVNCLLLKRKT